MGPRVTPRCFYKNPEALEVNLVPIGIIPLGHTAGISAQFGSMVHSTLSKYLEHTQAPGQGAKSTTLQVHSDVCYWTGALHAPLLGSIFTSTTYPQER